MMSKEELEKQYEQPDFHKYRSSEEDRKRKSYILGAIRIFSNGFTRALDLGACEGFITESLPADERHGFEISDNAAKRFSPGIERVTEFLGTYDLVIASGVLYKHYDVEMFYDIINQCASELLITCNLKEIVVQKELPNFEEKFLMEFPYRGSTLLLRAFVRKNHGK